MRRTIVISRHRGVGENENMLHERKALDDASLFIELSVVSASRNRARSSLNPKPSPKLRLLRGLVGPVAARLRR
jgi:hypothetical protein